ncbi:biotin transporter BioY [Anaerotignum sp.]|uniref:biotin transporter BioY n=1 Tax=Anaerotignum sp. TaxID=2039241 RepID=UPI003319B7E5
MKTKDLTKIALMTAIICILAPISIPIPASPVALTLCTFALYLSTYVLSPKQAVAATALYILIGAIGIPVFSGYTAGLAKFAGPGGGYIVGYLFLVAISATFVRKYPNSPFLQMSGALIGTIVTYIIGTYWMATVTNASFLNTLPAGALIFIPLDIVKIFISCVVGRKVQHYLRT